MDACPIQERARGVETQGTVTVPATHRSSETVTEESTTAVGALRLLLIEDSPEYAQLVAGMLLECAEPGELDIVHRSSLAAADPHLRDETLDCALLDLGLPDTTGLDGLSRIQEAAPAPLRASTCGGPRRPRRSARGCPP